MPDKDVLGVFIDEKDDLVFHKFDRFIPRELRVKAYLEDYLDLGFIKDLIWLVKVQFQWIFKNKNINELINIQNVNGEAKPYQIKQFLILVEKYNLRMEE